MNAVRRAAAASAALAFAAFLPALRNGFAWDDEVNFVGNPLYRGLGWTQLKWAFTTAYAGPYQPLSWLSASLDHALWGLDPFGYHLGNLLLHALNAALVCALAARLLREASPPSGPREEHRLALCAAAAAAFFALHPLRVEAVAWATERRTVLAGAFYFAAVILYLDAARAEERARRRGLRLSAAAFAASLLSKGIGAALPLTLLVLDAWPLRRLSADPRRWLGSRERAVLAEKLPFFALAAAFGVVQILAYSRHLPAGDGDPLEVRAAKASFALVFYGVETLAPAGLSPSYERLWPAPACAAALAAAAWALWRLRARAPAAAAAAAHYAFALLPVLGLVRFGAHAVADRYSYLPCVSWAVLAGGGLWALARDGSRAGRRRFVLALAAATVALAGLGARSWRLTGVWDGSIALWRHARAVEPSSVFARKSLARSYYNLGNALLQEGRPREAERLFRLSLGEDPEQSLAYNNLGAALLRRGAAAEAVEAFCRSLAADAANAGVEANLRAALAWRPALAARLDDDCRRRLTKRE